MSNDMKTETRERAGRTVKKGRKTKVHVVLLSPRYQDMGTRQNSQPGVLCLEWRRVPYCTRWCSGHLWDNQVDYFNCSWKRLTELRREDRNGKRDLGNIHRDGWNQIGPPGERRVQSAKATSLGSPTFRESGWSKHTERDGLGKHNGGAWKPREEWATLEGSPEGEVSP